MNFAWEPLASRVLRCRVPFCDVTVGLLWGSTGVLLVDTATTLAEATALDADVHRLTGHAVTHIVLTHKHFDHILGSSAFAGAAVYCAPEVAEHMTDGRDDLRADALRHGAVADEIDAAIAALRPPDHRVHAAVIDLGELLVSISHPGRGHTAADLIVSAPACGGEPPVVFCGDLVEESGHPVIDADSDLAAWPCTLDRVLDAGGPEARYVPGHGAVVDARFVEHQQSWLKTCRPGSRGRDCDRHDGQNVT